LSIKILKSKIMQDIKKIFEAQRVEFSDEGFSERVVRQLPERKSMLPQLVMVVFVMTGLAFTFAIQGILPMLEQINSLVYAISHLQAPTPSAVITYFGALGLIGIIGFAVARVDVR